METRQISSIRIRLNPPGKETMKSGLCEAPGVETPYCWRDWAAESDGITGDDLLAFIYAEDAVLPNGKKGADLFA